MIPSVGTSAPVGPRPPAATTEIAGRTAALHYGDVLDEYAALRTGAILVDRGARGRMRVEGMKAAEMLTGMVTNDVVGLATGRGLYAAALTPKGKIVADLRVFRAADHLLVDGAPRAWAGWTEMARKYLNPRWARATDVSDAVRDLGVYGMHARRHVAAVSGVGADELAALSPYGHVAAAVDGAAVLVARVPDIELEGYELFAPPEAAEELRARLVATGATPAGLLAWDIARVEAGRPEWGVDIDDSSLPQEANLDELHAISYTKGCYVGQEVVARIHFRGHVNRHLRGLLCGNAEPPPLGAELLDDAGKVVGDVRSGAVSPRLGAVALAMVRREVEPGATLAVRWPGGESTADVTKLPFPL